MPVLVLSPCVRAGRGTCALQEHLCCSHWPGHGGVGCPCGTLCLLGVEFLLLNGYASISLIITLSNTMCK